MNKPHPIPAEPRPNNMALAPGEAALAPVVETSAAAAAQMARTGIEARFQMALYRPRDWTVVLQRIEAACKRPRFAEEARYILPRGKSKIEGLSVRFAEEAKRALGNIMVEAFVTFDDDDRRNIRVMVTDFELNDTWVQDVMVEKAVERHYAKDDETVLDKRTNAAGKTVLKVRATEDDLLLKQNALVSKAARNGILRLLPADYQEAALAQVNATLRLEARNGENIARLVKAFAKAGVEESHLADYLGHSLTEMEGDEYVTLRGAYEAIRDGETTWVAFASTAPHRRGQAQPKPAPRGDGYDAAPKAERKAAAKAKAEAPAQAPASVPPEVMADPATRVPQGKKSPDPYAKEDECPHGVKRDRLCVECQQDAEDAAAEAQRGDAAEGDPEEAAGD